MFAMTSLFMNAWFVVILYEKTESELDSSINEIPLVIDLICTIF